MPKKRKRKTKKKSGVFGIIFVAAIIFTAFSCGIFLGITKGVYSYETHQVGINPEQKLTVNPVLPTATIRVPILVYHYVEFVKNAKDTIRKSLDILPPTFELQIKTLKDAKYNFIFASDIGQYLDGKKPLPQKPIVVTFDDGYGDFYTDVYPILKKYNVKVTEYIISGVLDKPNYMTTDQVKEISESGLVEIGAHTITHPNLPSLPPAEAEMEIEGSKSDLEHKLGINIVSFAYPYGGYNSDLAEDVRKSEYTNAVTTKNGTIVNQDNRYTLFRIHPGAAFGEELLKIL